MRFSVWSAVAALASLLVASPAAAGDIASFRPIGFSPDGDIFAFEEYGIQDGSGFPYSSIFFIDTAKDAFVPGTPIRVRIDDENAGLAGARSEAAAKAAPLLQKFTLGANPGLMAAFNPITETESPAHSLAYRQYAMEPPVGGQFALALEEVALAPSARCKDVTPQSTGFRLSFEMEDGQPSQRLLHTDEKIPESRNCPTGYRLGGVMVHHPDGAEPVHVVLVQVLSFGFEGRDGRWIAVPAPVTP